MCAVSAGSLHLASLLLRRGADANLTNVDDKTAWFLAVERHRPEIALMLDPETHLRTASVRGVHMTVI